MLQRWGYDIRYHEYPGYAHEGIPYTDQVISWFLQHKKNNAPEKVRVRAAALTSAKSHWLKILQRENPFTFIEAEAEVLINNTIRLASENVLAVELTPPADLINPDKKVTVVWNVNDIREVKPKDGKITLYDKNYKPARLNKNPDIEGPLSQVTTTPFAVVVGTSSKDSLMNKLCRQKAQEFVNSWKDWQKYEPRVFTDKELSEDDMKNFSLVLYGGPEANLITKNLIDKIPLKISSDKIEVTGKSFKVKDACIQMVYPHPLNSKRYVSVIGATSYAGMYFFTGGNDNLDFLIKDGCVANNRLGRPTDKLYVAKGVFDYNWQISDDLLDIREPEIRKTCPVRKVLPNLTTTIDNLPKIDLKVYKAIAGKYEIQPGVVLSVFIEADKLMAKAPDGNIIQLYPTSETEYFVDVADFQMTFIRNEDDSVTSGIVYTGGRKMEIKKIE
jgi:hypothetical protein